MNDTQTQIERLIELAIVQRSELKQLVSELPQLREHLNAEIERTFEEAEPQIRTELEEFCRARATDEHAKTGAALAAKVEQLSKQLEVTTAAKYSVLMAERLENANLLAKAEARIEDAASMLSSAVKEIVTDELSRFPRAGEIDQLRKEFAEPRGLNPRGRWMPDETYQRLDLVTVNGDSFVSNIDGNRERPSRTAGDWTLSAARGNGGGGGVTSLTDLVSVPSNGQLLIGNGSGFVNSTLTAGTGISISNGAGSITINATDGNITLDDGTAAAPALNFTNEPTTGLFRASANVMGFAVNGVSRATMTTTGVTVAGTITPTGSVHAAAGSVGNPSLAFNADQDTGLFNIGANNLGVAIGGAKVLDVASTGLTVPGALGATSLTSPASTNLTLGTGTLGAAITVLAADNNVGIGTTTPSSMLHIKGTSVAGTLRISGDSASSAAILSLSDASAGVGWNIRMVDYVGTGNLVISRGSTAGLGTDLFTIAENNGDVSIASSTAASANAGALVIAGGISAGNTGSAASYFGGSVSFPSDKGIISSVNDGRLFLDGSANQNGGGIILYGSAHGSFPAQIGYNGNTHVFKTVSGTQQLSLSLTDATFAGAVTSTSTGASFIATNSSANGAAISVKSTDTGGRDWYLLSNGSGSGAAGTLSLYDSAANVRALTATSTGNIGIGTNAPNANALLDISSTTKAFMPPRMTTTQKNAIASPTAGMVVYDSVLGKLSLYTTAWETITSV